MPRQNNRNDNGNSQYSPLPLTEFVVADIRSCWLALMTNERQIIYMTLTSSKMGETNTIFRAVYLLLSNFNTNAHFGFFKTQISVISNKDTDHNNVTLKCNSVLISNHNQVVKKKINGLHAPSPKQ